MLTNIRGLVNTLELGETQGMMPLYEAILNAIDAIGDSGKGMSAGRINIHLFRREDLAAKGSDQLQPLDGFSVQDNGVGFHDTHLAAFKEAYTLMRLNVGGKGVGRFTYLKVFDDVSIRSIFADKGDKRVRCFRFSIDREVHDETLGTEAGKDAQTGTTVTLKGIADRYRSGWLRDAGVIAQKIVAHFLIRFAARSCPPMWLHDEGFEPIDLHHLFNEIIQPHIEEIPIKVGEHEFNLQVFRHKGGRERHELNFCARGREVMKSKLRGILPELPDRFLDVDGDGKSYTLKVLVTGEYFDDNANTVRTEIVFNPDDDDLASEGHFIKRQEIDEEIAKALRLNLARDLKSTNEEKLQGIARFVEKAPEYRVLLGDKYRQIIEQRVPPGCTEEKLDEHLLHIRREIEDGVRKEERDLAAFMEKESFDAYKERIQELIETMNDVGKAKLADYVAHRRIILDLVDKSLKLVQQDGKYPFERVLHKMIFPMGVTSKDVFLEQQNLWLLDERLCFHTLLTSDKKLSSIAGLENTSGKKPDIFAFFYDTPIGVSEPENASAGIVIVEFKRPGRDDYDKDPADQIIQRFGEIDEGGLKNIDGRPINPINLRYLGYLIADLTPTLHRHVRQRYHRTSDGEGYFFPLAKGNGYIEIISYDKLIRDAKRRNRVLFEKLGIHKH